MRYPYVYKFNNKSSYKTQDKNNLLKNTIFNDFLLYSEKEAELERRFNLLKKELKNSLSIEGTKTDFLFIFNYMTFLESKKTLILKQREKLLLEGLLKIVNKRDQLVQHIDNQQKV